MPTTSPAEFQQIWNGTLIHGNALDVLPGMPDAEFQLIIADPPYYQVLEHEWDNSWRHEEEYLAWTGAWVRECKRLLRQDGLLFVFGQLGKREHVWLHLCSRLALEMQFHDMIIWDRTVGYNERRDSFTPQYEMILCLRQPGSHDPYFDKDAVRLPYDETTIQTYLKDPRYKDKSAREEHLRKGKFATNILRVPSLKGQSKEKAGHPSQKPEALIRMLISAASRPGDSVLDPFLGSGTTAVCCEALNRNWTGIEKEAAYVTAIRARLEKLTDGMLPL